MLAQQFHTAVAAARTGPELDELARGLWRAHAEGRLADADAQALSEIIKARRAALAAKAADGLALNPRPPAGFPGRQTPRKNVWRRPPTRPRSQRQGADHALGALPQP